MSRSYRSTEEEHLCQAALHLKEKKYSRACHCYLAAIKCNSMCKEFVKEKLIYCLRQLGELLETEIHTAELLEYYRQTCDEYPECEVVISNLGAILFQLGFVNEAACYFLKALSLNPGLLQARENLENILGHLVERWHFKMLNDKRRNELYKEALKQAGSQSEDLSLLDIGSGTGLLAMFGASVGYRKVFGCEMSRIMFELSNAVIAANGMKDKINIIPKISTELVVGKDLPHRAHTIVTETFDAGLFGERILETLDHAWTFLIKQDSSHKCKVIPGAATVYICAIESQALRKQNHVLYEGLPHLDLRGCTIRCSTSIVGDECYHDEPANEPYTCEVLSSLPGGYKILSEVVTLEKFTFSDHKAILQYCKTFTKELQIPITCPGRLDALCVWFDLHLTDTLTLSSSPEAESCWEQALYPICPSDLQSTQMSVRPGFVINASCALQDNALRICCTDIVPETPTEIHGADSKQTCLSAGNSSSVESPDSQPSSKCFYLPRPQISRLNDLMFSWTYCSALEKSFKKLSHSGIDIAVLILIDSFSFVPLQALKLGAQRVCIHGLKDREKELLFLCAQNNALDVDQLVLSSGSVDEIEGDWSVLVADLIEPSGCLRQQIFEDIAMTRLTALHSKAVVLPLNVQVYGMLIESETLCKDSKVINSDSTLKLEISSFINKYQMKNHMDIDLSTLNYRNLAEPFHLLSFDLNTPLDDTDDLRNFLNQEKVISVTCSERGTAHAVVYWFDLIFSTDGVLKLSTRNPELHWKQAAIMLDEFHVAPGMEAKLLFKCAGSCFKLDVLNPE